MKRLKNLRADHELRMELISGATGLHFHHVLGKVHGELNDSENTLAERFARFYAHGPRYHNDVDPRQEETDRPADQEQSEEPQRCPHQSRTQTHRYASMVRYASMDMN